MAAVLLVWSAGAAQPAGISLDQLLRRAGDQAELFWRQFSSISCRENVRQERINEKGNVINSQLATYDYLVFMQLVGNELSIEESRVLQGESKPAKRKRPSQRSLLVTNGFSMMLLVFHPYFQNSYVFTRMPDEEVDGVNLGRIDFEQIEGARSPSVLELKDRSYPLAWKGTAWLDPATGSIVRLKTELEQPMEQIGLSRLDSDVLYGATGFQESGQTFWLPRTALIEAETAHQSWRNRHEFSDYRWFSVKTEVSVGGPR